MFVLLFNYRVSSPFGKMFAKRGEITPPCGVPLSGYIINEMNFSFTEIDQNASKSYKDPNSWGCNVLALK